MDAAEKEVSPPAGKAAASVEPDASSENELLPGMGTKKNSEQRKMQNHGSLLGMEADKLPRNKSSMVLRMTAQMFHQHSEIFLRQAAVLERMASNPSDPSSWNLEEPSPESVQDRLHNENAVSLAIKSYESMLEVQKRVDYMERLMLYNGVEKKHIIRTKKRPVKKKRKIKNEQLPYVLFQQEHFKLLANDLGLPIGSDALMKEVRKLWNSMNPSERRRYKTMAESLEKANNRQTEESGDDSNEFISSDESDSEVDLLFQKEAGAGGPEDSSDDDETQNETEVRSKDSRSYGGSDSDSDSIGSND